MSLSKVPIVVVTEPVEGTDYDDRVEESSKKMWFRQAQPPGFYTKDCDESFECTDSCGD